MAKFWKTINFPGMEDTSGLRKYNAPATAFTSLDRQRTNIMMSAKAQFTKGKASALRIWRDYTAPLGAKRSEVAPHRLAVLDRLADTFQAEDWHEKASALASFLHPPLKDATLPVTATVAVMRPFREGEKPEDDTHVRTALVLNWNGGEFDLLGPDGEYLCRVSVSLFLDKGKTIIDVIPTSEKTHMQAMAMFEGREWFRQSAHDGGLISIEMQEQEIEDE